MKTTLNELLQRLPGRCLVLAQGAELPLAPGEGVELGPDGLPRAFRVLPYGPGSLTLDGARVDYEFRPEHAALIVAAAAAKGEDIPMDCEHASQLLAEAMSTTEGDLVRQPLIGERLAAGYLRPEARPDGLWAAVTRWSPRAAWLLTEKLYRYFSPVLRGLADGSLRLTSLALTNRPALDHLPPLALSEGGATQPAPAEPKAARGDNTRRTPMEFLTLLAPLLGMSSLALSEDHRLPAEATEKLRALPAELAGLRALRDRAGDLLALAADKRSPLDLQAALVVALETGKADHVALTEARTQLQQLQTAERQRLLQAAVAEGRMTPAMVEKLPPEITVLSLSELIAATPAGTFGGGERPERPAGTGEAVSALEAEIRANCGLPPKQ